MVFTLILNLLGAVKKWALRAPFWTIATACSTSDTSGFSGAIYITCIKKKRFWFENSKNNYFACDTHLKIWQKILRSDTSPPVPKWPFGPNNECSSRPSPPKAIGNYYHFTLPYREGKNILVSKTNAQGGIQ